MARESAKTRKVSENETYLDKVSQEVQSNQSRLSLILGALIVLVIGILVFNYFNRNQADLGPSQQTQQEEGDISPQNLPGKYTVKEGDTLFLIAQKYYNDGYKYEELVKENNLTNPNQIEVGQVLQIPKLEVTALQPSPTEEAQIQPSPTPQAKQEPSQAAPGTKGASDITMTKQDWGPKITGTTYTVVEGDWLSKIAGRAYGDIYAYDRIAKVNNIENPDLIYPGTILTIPR